MNRTWPNCCTATRVRSFGESGARREGLQGGVRAVEVIVMKVVRKEGGAVVAGVIGTGVGPLTSDRGGGGRRERRVHRGWAEVWAAPGKRDG